MNIFAIKYTFALNKSRASFERLKDYDGWNIKSRLILNKHVSLRKTRTRCTVVSNFPKRLVPAVSEAISCYKAIFESCFLFLSLCRRSRLLDVFPERFQNQRHDVPFENIPPKAFTRSSLPPFRSVAKGFSQEASAPRNSIDEGRMNVTVSNKISVSSEYLWRFHREISSVQARRK